MTIKNKIMTSKTFFLVPLLLSVLSLTIPPVFAGDYGYQATNPAGGEITKSGGRVWTYLNSITNNNNHIDRIIYLYDTSTDFAAGVGYFNSQSSTGTETYSWLRFWDQGGTYSIQHFLGPGGPSTEGWSAIEVSKVDTNTYSFKVGSTSLGNLDCSTSSCPVPTITGSASWGSSSSSSDSNKAQFDSLLLDDVGGTQSGYKSWQLQNSDYKCENNPDTMTAEMKFNFPLTGNSMDTVQIDLGSVDECSVDLNTWLYNGGGGA